MKIAVILNRLSIVFMLFCWIAFIMPFFSPVFRFNLHYTMLLVLIIVFFISVVGLAGVKDWRTALYSILAILGSISLFLIECLVVFVGSLLS